MKSGAFFRAGAALLLLPLWVVYGDDAAPAKAPPLPALQKESAPSLPDSSAPPANPSSPSVEQEPHQPLPQDHDSNWLLKGVQAEQKAAAKTEATEQTNAANAQATSTSATLHDQEKAISATDPLNLKPKAGSSQGKPASDSRDEKNGFKPLIGGLSGDTAKPLQGKEGQDGKLQAKASNLSKPITLPQGINPDLIRPIDFDHLESPAINPDIAPPTFNENTALSSVAIKVPTGYEGTGITAPVMPALPAISGPTLPSAPHAPALKTDFGAMPTAPRAIMPITVPTLAPPVIPVAPSIPSMPRLPDPNDEMPLRH